MKEKKSVNLPKGEKNAMDVLHSTDNLENQEICEIQNLYSSINEYSVLYETLLCHWGIGS